LPMAQKAVGVLCAHVVKYFLGHYAIRQLAGSLHSSNVPLPVEIQLEPSAEVNIVRGFQVIAFLHHLNDFLVWKMLCNKDLRILWKAVGRNDAFLIARGKYH